MTTRFRIWLPIRMVNTIDVTLAVSRTMGVSTPEVNRIQQLNSRPNSAYRYAA